MQQIPLSASIKAPASITKSKDSSSRTTAAVKPAAELYQKIKEKNINTKI
jgi:hypothetical protein